METSERLTLFEADFGIYLVAFWKQVGIQRIPAHPRVHEALADIFRDRCELLEDYFDVRFSSVDNFFSSIVASALAHYESSKDIYLRLDITYEDAGCLLGCLKGGGRDLMHDIAMRMVAYFPARHTYRSASVN